MPKKVKHKYNHIMSSSGPNSNVEIPIGSNPSSIMSNSVLFREHRAKRRLYAGFLSFSAKLINFAIQYNFACASIAILLIRPLYPIPATPNNEYAWISDWLLSSVFLGSIIGMIVFGYLADVVGNSLGMIIVMILCLGGIFQSTFGTRMGPDDNSIGLFSSTKFEDISSTRTNNDIVYFYSRFIMGRFLLGVGVGGMYPISAGYCTEGSKIKEEEAALEAESADSEDPETGLTTTTQQASDPGSVNVNDEDIELSEMRKIQKQIRDVAWAFTYQCPGSIAPSLIAIPIVCLITAETFPQGGKSMAIDTQFRLILGLGMIPCVLQLLLSVYLLIRFEIGLGFGSAFGRWRGRRSHASIGSPNRPTSPVLGSQSQSRIENLGMMGAPPSSGYVSSTNTSPNQNDSTQLVGVTDPSTVTVVSTSTSSDKKWRVFFYDLIGTGGTWFIFDVAYYGTALCTPFILEEMISQDSLVETFLQSVVTSAMSFNATIVCIPYMEEHGLAKGSSRGFLLMCTAFSMLALACSGLFWDPPGKSKSNFDEVHTIVEGTIDGEKKAKTGMEQLVHVIYVLLLAFVTFTTGWGPNVSTYVVPTIVFPEEVRSTFHGLSAGMGKLGALGGAFMYPLLTRFHLGVTGIMTIQAVLCLLGYFVSEATLGRNVKLKWNVEVARKLILEKEKERE